MWICELRIRVLVTANNATFWYTVSILEKQFTVRTFYHFFVSLLCRSHFSSFEIKKYDEEKRQEKKFRTKRTKKKEFHRFLHIFRDLHILYVLFGMGYGKVHRLVKYDGAV